MCGIAGIFHTDPAATADPEILQAMADSLAHRGPDDEGLALFGNAGLAHRRLSIIDVAGGRQPMGNEDGSVVVVFNGEIYDHEARRAELASRGHRFATRSDTEVIVHAYEERGRGCVDALRGMFAFALFDRRRQRLLLARDRLGIKPLYYWTDLRTVVFASEIKALLEHPAVPREVDPEALDLYLSLRYVPGPATLFRGIRKLQPGHVAVCDERGMRIRRYWDLASRARDLRFEGDPAERFAEVLEESVRMRLMSEVPLGVFLSGGIDSTTVLALMAGERNGRPLQTFSVGYAGGSSEERESDELAFARLAARHFGTEHHEVRLEAADFLEALPRLAWHLDEPVADPACVPLYFLSRRASERVTVVLSGEGADEILGGYGIYRRMLALETAHRAGLGRAGRLASALASLLPGERLRLAARMATRPLERRYRGVSRGFLPEEKARLTGRDRRDVDRRVDDLLAARFPGPGPSALERMLRFDLDVWLPDDLLVKADKMTMAHSQELRVPFLDHRLVELAAALPADRKVRDGKGKVLLRETMASRIPTPILERPKKGFPVPTVPVLRTLGPRVRDLLLAPTSACRNWFEASAIEKLVDGHLGGRAEKDQEIWSLLLFELWHGVFLDGRFAPAPRARAEETSLPIRITG